MAKTIPEITEVQLQSFKATQVVQLLQEAAYLKDVLDPEHDDYGYDSGLHVGRRYKEVMEELAEIQQAEALEGLKYQNIVFTLGYAKPRVSVDVEKLKQELVFRGVDPEVVADCVKAAEKVGKESWRKEIKVK